MATVSIIVPSFNHRQFIGACLESVLAQTFEEWELLLHDDCSTDDSVDIARRYALSDARIKVSVNRENLGTYGTQASALGQATGEFVAVLNSDDFWHPHKLEAQVATLKSNRAAPLCYVLGWKADEGGAVDTSEDVHSDWPIEETQDVLPYLLHENRILASGVLFRRD